MPDQGHRDLPIVDNIGRGLSLVAHLEPALHFSCDAVGFLRPVEIATRFEKLEGRVLGKLEDPIAPQAPFFLQLLWIPRRFREDEVTIGDCFVQALCSHEAQDQPFRGLELLEKRGNAPNRSFRFHQLVLSKVESRQRAKGV